MIVDPSVPVNDTSASPAVLDMSQSADAIIVHPEPEATATPQDRADLLRPRGYGDSFESERSSSFDEAAKEKSKKSQKRSDKAKERKHETPREKRPDPVENQDDACGHGSAASVKSKAQSHKTEDSASEKNYSRRSPRKSNADKSAPRKDVDTPCGTPSYRHSKLSRRVSSVDIESPAAAVDNSRRSLDIRDERRERGEKDHSRSTARSDKAHKQDGKVEPTLSASPAKQLPLAAIRAAQCKDNSSPVSPRKSSRALSSGNSPRSLHSKSSPRSAAKSSATPLSDSKEEMEFKGML